MKTIYIVEDHDVIRNGVLQYMSLSGFDARGFATIGDAREAFSKAVPDLLVQDVMLPDGDGFSFVKVMKEKHPSLPVIFLTARVDESDRILGFELGADDYITKPFTLQVLLARIKTVLRRNQRDVNKARKVKSGNLIIDFDHRTVHSEGKEIAVTPTQFHILKLLVSNHGITITRDQITSILWNQNDEFVEDNTLSVHISNLKSKIGKFNGKPYLESVRGVGYQWKLDVVLYTD